MGMSQTKQNRQTVVGVLSGAPANRKSKGYAFVSATLLSGEAVSIYVPALAVSNARITAADNGRQVEAVFYQGAGHKRYVAIRVRFATVKLIDAARVAELTKQIDDALDDLMDGRDLTDDEAEAMDVIDAALELLTELATGNSGRKDDEKADEN